MQTLKLFISVPFRSFGTASYFPNALFSVGDSTKVLYGNALIREINAASTDAEDCLVDEIEFGNGPFDSMNSRELTAIMRAIKQNFHMAENVLIHGYTIPGGVTADSMGFMHNEHFTYLEIEMLSANISALQHIKLPPVAENMRASSYVIQMSGGITTGIILDGSLDTTWLQLLKSIQEACNQEPAFIRFITLPSEFEPQAIKYLTEHGYTIREGMIFSRPGLAPLQLSHDDQLGFGINACTILDGLTWKNTNKLNWYLEHSDDFSSIAAPIDQTV